MDPVVCRVGDLIDFVSKLGELPGRLATLVLQHVRRQNKLIAISHMGIYEIVEQGAHSSQAPIPLNQNPGRPASSPDHSQ